MQYNWQQKDWPNFTYDLEIVRDRLLLFAEKLGRTSGLLKGLSEERQLEAVVDRMVSEAIKTSAIEGEFLSRQDVISSIKNNLGLNPIKEPVKDKRAKGVSELVYTIRTTYEEPLTNAMLHQMHTMLMAGSKRIKTGDWRTGIEPMQVISGTLGREIVHFEAPPASSVPSEMEAFIQWFNDTNEGGTQFNSQAPIRAALIHVYFESIHPYEDGNGRIGRALSEKALYQGVGTPIPISLSYAIEARKQAYYQALKNAQKSNEVTDWLIYFVDIIIEAQEQAEQQIHFILRKTKFFDRFKTHLNERQEKVLRRMLAEGVDGFKGGINAKKYMSIAKTSKATATRDMQKLVVLNIFNPIGGGRSTRYELNLGE